MEGFLQSLSCNSPSDCAGTTFGNLCDGKTRERRDDVGSVKPSAIHAAMDDPVFSGGSSPSGSVEWGREVLKACGKDGKYAGCIVERGGMLRVLETNTAFDLMFGRDKIQLPFAQACLGKGTDPEIQRYFQVCIASSTPTAQVMLFYTAAGAEAVERLATPPKSRAGGFPVAGPRVLFTKAHTHPLINDRGSSASSLVLIAQEGHLPDRRFLEWLERLPPAPHDHHASEAEAPPTPANTPVLRLVDESGRLGKSGALWAPGALPPDPPSPVCARVPAVQSVVHSHPSPSRQGFSRPLAYTTSDQTAALDHPNRTLNLGNPIPATGLGEGSASRWYRP